VHEGQYRPARASPRASSVTESGRQAARVQQSQRSRLGHVDDGRTPFVTGAEERHDAVVTRVGAVHHAVVTVDSARHRLSRIHCRIFARGCDTERGAFWRQPVRI
jgi:hypothetical protein